MTPLPLARPTPRQHPPAWFGLRGQFVLMGAALLSLACITLGWFFVRQQILTITDGLYQTGILLGENLAANSQYSLISRDRDELRRLAHGILAAKDVAYVSIFTDEGRPLLTIGKSPWEPLLTTQGSVASPIHPALSSLRLDNPAIGEVHLENGKATYSPGPDHSIPCLIAVLLGQNMNLFFDTVVPIHSHRRGGTQDPSLRLLFDQHEDPISPALDSSKDLLGIVEVGMSSQSVQEHIRRELWEAIGIITLIMMLSFLLLSFFSHRITTSLRRLTVAANRAADGESQIDLPQTAGGEIGNLAQVFSHMLRSIYERETALQNLNHTLEARIASRTEELRLVNRKLEELNHRKSLFVSTASHEIKTPLTSVTCHLDNLLMGVDGPLSKDQTRVLERVQVNIGRLQLLLVSLLDLCKIELGEEHLELQRVNLEAVVTQAIEGLQSLTARKNLFIDLDIPSTLPLVAADAEKLYQIVMNLLHNALKFSPDRSTIHITGQLAGDGFVRIAIQDSGCGIAREEAEKIFEPFYRSKHIAAQTRGTGLGLPISKHLVELHRGRLWVESEMGHGTCFFFTLPMWVHAHPHDEPVLTSKQSSPVGVSGSSEFPM